MHAVSAAAPARSGTFEKKNRQSLTARSCLPNFPALLQEAFNAAANHLASFITGNHALQQAEVDLDSHVVVCDVNGSIYRGTQEAHAGGQRKSKRGALPAVFFV